MSIKIEIEVTQEKDGSMYVIYKGKRIAELSQIRPTKYARALRAMISTSELLGQSNLAKVLDEKIEEMLAKLLAYYAVDV